MTPSDIAKQMRETGASVFIMVVNGDLQSYKMIRTADMPTWANEHVWGNAVKHDYMQLRKDVNL